MLNVKTGQLQVSTDYGREDNTSTMPAAADTNGGGGGGGGVPRASLICRPNSHPFQDRMLGLDQPVKVGRSVARARPLNTNAIFDCKVRKDALYTLLASIINSRFSPAITPSSGMKMASFTSKTRSQAMGRLSITRGSAKVRRSRRRGRSALATSSSSGLT